ncbi:MAG: TIM-barrel domain-containing protein, partial [Ruminiclostridium sp.]
MIEKFVLGEPFETFATVKRLTPSEGEIPFFTTIDKGFFYKLSDNDIVYGLGEQVGGINKRGKKYISRNIDNPHHQEDTLSLYGAHNFLIISGEELFGVFFDYPGFMEFDIGYTNRDELTITAENMDMDVYIITGNSERDIVKQFRKLIGKSYIPPKWAFGYGQSRWGYKCEGDIREVARRYRENNIPLDSIYLDIDYMEDYKDFTVNKEAFSDLKGLCEDMKKEGIRLVPIIDAGVKIEKGYSVYEEGVEKGYFCTDREGNPFIAAVWPGRVHFPDFLDPKAREWFGDKYSVLLDMGIEGFWNDMNEPAIFYSEKRLNEVLERINELGKKNMGISEFFEFTGIVNGLSNNQGDYDEFFHNVGEKSVPHRRLHNLYGFNMTKAAGEAFERLSPDKRILMFSRSSYIGAHRYGGIWQGDNKSWWSHLLMNMQMTASLNMVGFLYTGADTGGFGCDTTEELMLRWLQLSVFMP